MSSTKVVTVPNSLVLSADQTKELVVNSDHQSPVSIEGTAMGKVRGTPIIAYFAVYKVGAKIGRIQVNQDTYETIRSLVGLVKVNERMALQEWVNKGDAP